MLRATDSYVSVNEALEKLVSRAKTVSRIESVNVDEAYSRVLGRDIFPLANVPPYDSSHMDGYAVNSADTASASEEKPVKLRIKGETRLGESSRLRLARGGTVKVPTGGYLPRGADAVVPVELTRRDGSIVSIFRPSREGEFVYQAGTDVRKGEVLFQKGRLLKSVDIGLLITIGIRKTRVYRKPRVAIISTGNELSDYMNVVKPGRIPNSHGYIFARLVEEAGATAVPLGVVGDDVGKIIGKLREGLRLADMVLTVGGTSMGELDLVGKALGRLTQEENILHGLRMDRGRVAGFGIVQGKPVLMLPGPIQGGMNALLLLGMPAIRKISGRPSTAGPPVKAVMKVGWKARKRFENFTKVVYAKVNASQSPFEVEPISGATESMTTLSRANGYLVVPEEVTEVKEGAEVAVYLFPGLSHVRDGFLSQD